MKKWIIIASSIAVLIIIVATGAVAFTYMQKSEISGPRSGNVDLPTIEEPLTTLDEEGRGSQPPKSIEEVKDAWEKQLLARPGVTGVAIGLTKDGQEKAIKVYVNRRASAQAARIPTEIEGYPVEVESRGTFRAW